MIKTESRVRYFDHFVFDYCVKQLDTATPEDIVAFYVDKFIFRNAEYFKEICELYKLPNDLLKLHSKVTDLATMPYMEHRA